MGLKKLFSEYSKSYYKNIALKNWDSIDEKLGPQPSYVKKRRFYSKSAVLKLCSLFLFLTLAATSFFVLQRGCGSKMALRDDNYGNSNGSGLFNSDGDDFGFENNGGNLTGDSGYNNPAGDDPGLEHKGDNNPNSSGFNSPSGDGSGNSGENRPGSSDGFLIQMPDYLIYQDKMYCLALPGTGSEKAVYSEDKLLDELLYNGKTCQLYPAEGDGKYQELYLFYPLDDGFSDQNKEAENYNAEKNGFIGTYYYFCDESIIIKDEEYPVYFGDGSPGEHDFALFDYYDSDNVGIPDGYYLLKNVSNDKNYSDSVIEYKLDTLESETEAYKLKNVDPKDAVLLDNGLQRILLLRKGFKF